MYTAFIVDDEKHQQETLVDLLTENFPQYSVAAVCSSVPEAVEKIKSLKPQLVFLDVVMPPHTGFDLLTQLEERNFEVIFTTSHEQYAIHAFKVSAVDYLLKPFGKNELGDALKKFEGKISDKKSSRHMEVLLQNLNSTALDHTKIALPTLSGFVFVQVKDIVRCKADNTYTTFFISDKRQFVVSKSMKECEELLRDFNFFRTHVSHLINMNQISEYLKGDGGTVKMTDGASVDVSRHKKDEFLKQLRKI